ncbi:MAG: tRNA pseudouridine(55) synthase TruB [candidate division WOR-3 bacterium]
MSQSSADGILLVNKPRGLSSYDVIREIKKVATFKKIGHAGTLDPIATGLLIILFNNATKIFSIINSYPKVYRAKIRLGLITDTDDLTGKILEEREVKRYEKEEVLKILERYQGEIAQVPPVFSALKEKGVPKYLKARRGEEISLRPRKVKIFWLELLSLEKDSLEIRAEVGKGVYLRSLARDIGKDLGCGGTLQELTRERIGKFHLEDALSLPITSEEIIKKNLRPLSEALYPFPEITLDDKGVKNLLLGKKVRFDLLVPDDYLKVFSERRDTLILAKREGTFLKPVRILYANSENKG